MAYQGQHNLSYFQPQPATDSSYYQPEPAKCNQCQKYCQYRRTQQDCPKNGYDRDKVGKHGNIHSKYLHLKKAPIILLVKNKYAIKNNPNDSS